MPHKSVPRKSTKTEKRLWIIPRPHAQGMRSLKICKERGIAAVLAPLMEIRKAEKIIWPHEDQVILLTSRTALKFLSEHVSSRHYQIFVVGENTAQLAVDQGFHKVSYANDVKNLYELILHDVDPQDSFLWYGRGVHVTYDLGMALIQKGYELTSQILYEAQAVQTLPEEIVRVLQQCDQKTGILFFSSRQARIYCELLRKAGLVTHSSHQIALCLSPQIAQTLAAEDLSWQDMMISTQPRLDSLLDLLQAHDSC